MLRLNRAAPLRAALRHSAPAVRPLTRAAHFDNTVHNNFPFDHGNKTKFGLIYWGALSLSGVVVPVAALYLQLYKGGAYDTVESSKA